MLKNSPMDEFPPEPSTACKKVTTHPECSHTDHRQSPAFANYERNPFFDMLGKVLGFFDSKGVFSNSLKGLRYFFCQQKFGQNPGESKGVVCFLATDPKHVVVSCCVLRSFAKSGFATHTEQFQLYQCHSETRCSLLVQGNTELSSSNLVNVWLAR